MFKLMLGFITGVILLYFSGDLINSSKYSLNYYIKLYIAFSGMGLLILLRVYFSQIRLFTHIIIFLVGLIMGFCYALMYAEQMSENRLNAKYDQQIIDVTAYLCGLPKQGKYTFSADFCLLDVYSVNNDVIPGAGFKARLRWPIEGIDELEVTKGIHAFRVKVRQPKSTVNFIGVSYESRLFYERIILLGDVKAFTESSSVDTLNCFAWWRYHYHQTRKSLKNYVDGLLSEVPQQGVIHALLIGDKSHLSADSYKILANTGTQHLIAISGLHVGLVMFGVYGFLPASRRTLFIVSILGAVYVLLVGFSPSAQRAWLMCMCALLYLEGYLNIGKWRVFVSALCLVLLLDPLATLNLGFWYSFLCVAVLFLLSQTLSMAAHPWRALFCLQLLLSIGMLPMSSMLGMKHGLENILANLLVIPWVSLFVLPLTLLWFGMSFFSEMVSNGLLSLLNGSITLQMAYLSSLKIFNIPLAINAQGTTIFCFSVCFVFLLFFHKLKAMLGIYVLALTIAIIFPSRLAHTDAEFSVFDVGQGLALAFKVGDDIWIYDTGSAMSKLSFSERVILPYLRRHQKTSTLTGLIISHGDADHAGGLPSLFEYTYPVHRWSGEPERLAVQGFDACHAGMHWEKTDFQVQVLYPFPNSDLSTKSANDHSCVVRFSLKGKVFLLMGDLEKEAELAFVSHYRDELKADVLIAGHHGAASSSSFALLKHVKPEYIVFSAGYLNRFGHPANVVLDRVATFGSDVYKQGLKSTVIKVFNTIEHGAVLFKVDSVTGKIYAIHARENVRKIKP